MIQGDDNMLPEETSVVNSEWRLVRSSNIEGEWFLQSLIVIVVQMNDVKWSCIDDARWRWM